MSLGRNSGRSYQDIACTSARWQLFAISEIEKENNLDSTTSKDSSGIRSSGRTLVFCSNTASAGR
jgi:hypothetical protein